MMIPFWFLPCMLSFCHFLNHHTLFPQRRFSLDLLRQTIPKLFRDKLEIVFFDVETSVPTQPGQGFAILEFGSIMVCPRKLIELQHYSTLVRPADLSLISHLYVRCNGITKDVVISAPTFADITDQLYHILHGRIWAGHNILRFHRARIREAFAEINSPAPAKGNDRFTLALLTQRFGRRAGDMKRHQGRRIEMHLM